MLLRSPWVPCDLRAFSLRGWSLLCWSLLLFAVSGDTAPAEMREFYSNDGRSIEARVVELTDAAVVIERKDGEIFTVPLASLSVEDQGYLRTLDITRFLLGPFWETPLAREHWQVISSEGGELLRLTRPSLVFGEFPVTIDLWVEDDRPVRLQATYIEAGSFFRYRQNPREVRDREQRRRLQEMERNARRQDQEDRRAFPGEFRRIERKLPQVIEAMAGDRLRMTGHGSGQLRTQVRSVAAGEVNIQLFVERDQLIMLVIEPAEAGVAAAASSLTRGQRQRIRAENAVRHPNGDVIIEGVPMIPQGTRGYCAVGSLTMVARYHGVSVDIDFLAAQAGYREGEVRNAALRPIYQEVARQGKLRLLSTPALNVRDICNEIDQGRPVLVWRYFTRERDAWHSLFANEFLRNEAFILPHPNRGSDGRRDRQTWPTADNSGHASVITGFNKERGEFIFSESWGEETRNRRMRFEEMKETVYFVWMFR